MPLDATTIPAAMYVAKEQQINKASLTSQVTNGFSSLWRSTGIPTQAAVPTAWAILSEATVGALALPARTGLQERALGGWNPVISAVNATFYMADRLGAMGGLSGTVITAQTVNADISVATSNLANRLGLADFSCARWFLEWYTATGSTGVNATVAVTYGDNTTGNIVVAVPVSTGAARMIEIVPTNGKWIKSIQNVTLSATTGTAGNFGITAVRNRAAAICEVAFRTVILDHIALRTPDIEDNTCLFNYTLTSSAATGTLGGDFIQMVA